MTSEHFELGDGIEFQMMVDGEEYTLDEVSSGNAVFLPRGRHGGVGSSNDSPRVVLQLSTLADAEDLIVSEDQTAE